MKLISTILLLIISTSVKSQCDTTSLDTIPVVFDMAINTPYFDYYNANGVIAWRKVKFDSTLIPTGGYARRITNNKRLEGYAVFKVLNPITCQIYMVRWMDLYWKDIDGTVKYYEFKR